MKGDRSRNPPYSFSKISTSTLGGKAVYPTLRLSAGSGGEFERAEQYFNTAIDYCRRNDMSPCLAPAQQPDPEHT